MKSYLWRETKALALFAFWLGAAVVPLLNAIIIETEEGK